MEYIFKRNKRHSVLKKGDCLVLAGNEIKKSRLPALLMMLLGVSLASNIVYIFSFGSTYFTVSEVYSTVLFFYLIAARKVAWKSIIQIMGLPFQLFCVVIAFSGILAFITFFNVGLMYRFLAGVVSFCICLTTLVDTIALFEYRMFFVKGCMLGTIVNGIFGVVQYVFYQANIPFTFLYDMFPQASFHLNIYNFCAQGLFLEPSHMNQFLATVVPLCIGFIGLKKTKNKLFLILVLMCCALSTSGTAAVVLVGLLLLALIERPLSRRVSKSSFWFGYALILITTVAILFFSSNSILVSVSNNISKYVELAVEGSNIGDASNVERVHSMQEALKLIPQNPLGCGWNMVHTLLEQKTNLGTASAFSDMLEMTLEIGVLGVGLYIISACDSILTCLKLKNFEATGVAVSIICVLTMETLADYAINPCIMSALAFGMCYRSRYIAIN